ncbi:MAG TPA: hypothetical protein VIG73_05685 [Cerasibacillus sp.]|uniref:hypothetical protein n=1 Tax=Cerasibacillus sp. TaxID=2498711 RepID=UPI002F3F26C0
MKKELKQIVDETQTTYGLEDYYLGRYHLYRDKNSHQETSYYLSMEWFPNKYKDRDKEEENPEGTAAIEVHLHTKAVHSIIFVGGVTYATKRDAFPIRDLTHVIEWIENETGLTWGKQFQLVHEKNGEFLFKGVIDNIPVYPSAVISVQFNNTDQFTGYSINGVFPKDEEVNWEPFNLLPDMVETFIERQCQRVQFPNIDQKKWRTFYAIEELFVTNDGKHTIPFEIFQSDGQYVELNHLIEWDEPIQSENEFVGEPIFVYEEIDLEQALQHEPHPDLAPITEDDITACINATTLFLRQQYPAVSRKWNLKQIRRDQGFLVALLKPATDTHIFSHKINIFIDSETKNVVNYIDSSMLFTDFQDYEDANEINISHADALDKLRKYIKVTPVYVYDKSKNSYLLCGKIDCHYGVDATTGEMFAFNEL